MQNSIIAAIVILVIYALAYHGSEPLHTARGRRARRVRIAKEQAHVLAQQVLAAELLTIAMDNKAKRDQQAMAYRVEQRIAALGRAAY